MAKKKKAPVSAATQAQHMREKRKRKDYRHVLRLENLARILFTGEFLKVAMRQAGYTGASVKNCYVMHEGKTISPYKHPIVIAELERLKEQTYRTTENDIEIARSRFSELYEMAMEKGNHEEARRIVSDAANIGADIVIKASRINAPVFQGNKSEAREKLLGVVRDPDDE